MFRLLIRDMRLKLGMTQKELAEEMGLSQSYISKLENFGYFRDAHPSIDVIEDFGKRLNCCPFLLMKIDCEYCSICTNEEDKRKCWVSTRAKIIKVLQEEIEEEEKRKGVE